MSEMDMWVKNIECRVRGMCGTGMLPVLNKVVTGQCKPA